MSERSDGLSEKQIAAIRKAEQLGAQIAQDHPGMAVAYERGATHDEIVHRFGLLDVCHTQGMARTAVYNALKILIPDDAKRLALGRRNMIENGKLVVEEGTGIHGLTPEQKYEIGKKAGRRVVELQAGVHAATHEQLSKWGQRARDLGVGIHGLSDEERSAASKDLYAEGNGIGGASSEELSEWGQRARDLGVGIHGLSDEERKEVAKLAMAARGAVPWNNDNVDFKSGLGEFDFCAKLINSPEFQRKVDDGAVVLELQMIADIVNQVFHGGKEVRSKESVGDFNRRYGVLEGKAVSGLAARTEAEKKLATKEGILARGKIPWENFSFDPETGLDEHHTCVNLLNDERFQFVRGGRTCSNLQAVADELNRIFHDGKPVRTKSSVGNFRYQRMGK